ncbi:hypothetical protein RUND412_001182 [Rhizina undulata]
MDRRKLKGKQREGEEPAALGTEDEEGLREEDKDPQVTLRIAKLELLEAGTQMNPQTHRIFHHRNTLPNLRILLTPLVQMMITTDAVKITAHVPGRDVRKLTAETTVMLVIQIVILTDQRWQTHQNLAVKRVIA